MPTAGPARTTKTASTSCGCSGPVTVGSGPATSAGPPRPPTDLRVADATNRQRFTIAHEIGHAILFKSLSERPEALAGLRDPANSWADVEALCDVAAGRVGWSRWTSSCHW